MALNAPAVLRSQGIWHLAKSAAKEMRLHSKNTVGTFVARKIASGRKFRYDGEEYDYLVHKYNMTWSNERAVEIPIFSKMVRRATGRVLEVGNVLSHYVQVNHDVIDRYEKSPTVLNADAETYRANHLYSLIISISTIEHIGFDETHRDSRKVERTLDNLKSMLAAGGILAVSVPMGYNSHLDRRIREHAIEFSELRCLKRDGFMRWSETPYGDGGSNGGWQRGNLRTERILLATYRH